MILLVFRLFFFGELTQKPFLFIYLLFLLSLRISQHHYELLLQVFQPWVQTRRLVYVKHKHVISGILKQLKMRSLGRLSTDDGRPNEEVLTK